MLSRCEQVAGVWKLLFIKRQQSNFRRGVRLDRAILENVADGDAAFGEATPNQETAVTIKRFALGAHQTNARAPCDVEQPTKASDIVWLDRHGFVVGYVITIEPVVPRAAAERLPHGGVADPGGRERRRKRSLRKPRTEARLRRAAHVRDRIHSGALQQHQKTFSRNVRMTDAEEIVCRHIRLDFHVGLHFLQRQPQSERTGRSSD